MNRTKIHSIIESELMVRADIYKRLISKALRTKNLWHIIYLAHSRIQANHKCEYEPHPISISPDGTSTLSVDVCYCRQAAIDFVDRLGGNSANN